MPCLTYFDAVRLARDLFDLGVAAEPLPLTATPFTSQAGTFSGSRKSVALLLSESRANR